MNIKEIQKMSKRAMFGLVGGMMAAGLWSCSSDEPAGNVPGSSEGDVYAKLTLALPTRSVTDDAGHGLSDAGTEVGKDRENNVGSVLVILMDKSGNFVTSSYTDALQNTSKTDPTYSVRFESLALAKAAGTGGLDVNVYAVCNPTPEILNVALAEYDEDGNPTKTISNDVLDQIVDLEDDYNTTLSQSIYWRDNAFVMSSAHMMSPNQKPTYEELITNNNKPEKAFDLGTIDVKRVSARFDFASTTVDPTLGANVYPIKSNADESKVVATVTVDGLALVNVAKNFYLFPRVSADGTNTNWDLLGSETRSNYVVSPNWTLKSSFDKNSTASWLATAVDGTLAAKDLIFTTVAEINGNEEDSPNDWNNDGANTNDYRIWRYVTENTIPVIDQQKNGITTGVVFRAEIKAGKDADDKLKLAFANGDKLYAYNGTLYGNITMLTAMAAKNVGSPLYNDFVKSFGAIQKDKDGNVIVPADLAGTDANFDVYAQENGKYYTYYYYWNRHNDNGDPNVMGAMEFGVVRNNVYKLAVTTINGFGQPTDKPEDPGNPDETPHAYFKVSVRVLPWIVRVNNIEF